MIPRDLRFLQSEMWIHILWLIPLTFLFVYSLRKQLKNLKQIIQEPLIPYVTHARSAELMGLKWLAFVLAWVLAILALMMPKGEEFFANGIAKTSPLGEIRSALNIEILIDTSQSMGVADVMESPDRLGRAKGIVSLFLSHDMSDQIALSTFTSRLHPISPLTYDHTFLQLLVSDIKLNEGDAYGTDFKNVFEALQNQTPKIYLLFSDGGDNQEIDLPSLLELAKSLKSPIITIGVGSEKGGVVPDILSNGQPITSKLDAEILQQISAATRGRYFSSESFTEQDLASLLKIVIERKRLEGGESTSLSLNAYTLLKDYFQIPLGLSLLFFLLYKFIPSTAKPFLIFIMLFPCSMYAKDAGQSLFEQGRYKEALTWYRGELLLEGNQEIQDKIFYNLALLYKILEDHPASLFSLAMISPKALEYPLFREKILNLLKSNQSEMQELDYWLAWLYSRGEMKFLEQFPQLQSIDQGKFKTLTKEKASQYGAELQWSFLQKDLNVQEILMHSLYFLGMYRLISSNFNFDQLSRSFNQAVMYAQGRLFQERQCNCNLWNELVPLFSDGIDRLKEAKANNTLIYAFIKWSQAYHLLQNPPEVSSQKREDLEELQIMQSLDKTPAIESPLNKGIPW